MSDISITGNEAQFNENVTFLKDVNIGGFLSLPNQQLSLSRLNVPDIRGVPSLQITGVTTFTDDATFLGNVTFSQALSFPDLEVRDRLRVGIGGTVITADSRLNPGKVGIGSAQPTELLDVGGKAKILDLDLRNLYVTGFSTFLGIVEFQDPIFIGVGATVGFGTTAYFRDNAKAVFGDDEDLKIYHNGSSAFIDNTTGRLFIRDNGFGSINLQPTSGENSVVANANSSVDLFFDGDQRLSTSGVGITVFGDIIVPDVGIRTSRVGLGTDNPDQITNLLDDTANGKLRLAIDGSLAITRNLYDSAGSPGASGAFLNRDETGVRWVTFEPSFSEGIFIQDEGNYIPLAGAAKSYSIVNFKSINSFGEGTDTVRPEDAGTDSFNIVVENKTGTLVGSASTILFLDNTTNIEVGQLVVCDTNGVVSLGATVLAVPAGNTAGVVTISQASLLSSDVTSTFDFGTSDFFGLANILTFDLWGFVGSGATASVYRMSNVGIGSSVPSVSLDVVGDTRLKGELNVTGISTFEDNAKFDQNVQIVGRLDVDDQTQSIDTTSGAVVVDGGVGIVKNLNIGEILTVTGNIDANADLDVDGQTDLDVLNVAELATFEGNIDANANLDVAGNTVLGDASDDTLTVNATSTFNANVVMNADLNVDGHTEIDDLRVSGVSTFVGIATFSKDIFVEATTDTDQLNVTGVSTFKDDVEFHGASGITSVRFDKSDNSFKFIDNAKLKFGDGNDLHIFHSGNHSIIRDEGAGNLILTGKDILIQNVDNGETMGFFDAFGPVNLHYDGTKRFSTSGIGATVFGQLDTTDLKVSGVSTFVGITTQKSTLFTTQLSASGISTFESDIDANANLDVDGHTELDDLRVSGVSTFSDTVDLDGPVKDINDSIGYSSEVGVCKTDYRLASVGTGVSWRPSGVQTKRTIWVSKNGCDTNSGLLEGDAKATVGAAASIAVETDTIKIRPGVYEEDNPIGLRTDVSVTGEDLRLCIIKPKNTFKDVFHVRRGCLIENLNFGGSNVGIPHDGAACVAFPTPVGPDSAITGYTEPGPANEGPSGRWRSPYIRNCTNFMTGSIGMKVDGNNADARFTGVNILGADLKSMVCDSFTQYNEAGIGVSLTNNAYAQLVSIFTINTDIGIFASSGAQCDLTNSNSSFGNFGLVAVGLGSTQFTGIVSSTNPAGELIASTNPENQDTVVVANLKDSDNNVRRPFDGQALYFKIKVTNYIADVNIDNLQPGTLDGEQRITSPLEQLSSVKLIDGADLTGFSAIDPPSVLIRDADGEVEPKGPQGIIAEAVADIDAAGKLVGVDVIASGRNYFSGQNIVVDIEGNTGLATAVMEPIFYTVETATIPTVTTGITSITFNEFIPYELFPDDPFSLQRISRILTSSHSFEYVGTGTDINIATPLQGAIPIKANEVVASDGAQIPFTSTDQQGNFDIGAGLQINQTTSTISGRDFSRSIQAEVTPLILALR